MDHGAVSRAADRPQWTVCLDHLREGDTLVVCSLDRVAGTEAMAIEIIRDLATRAVRFRSLTEPFLDIDTTTPPGEAIVGILTVLGQLRVSTVRENTRRGLGQARARGRAGGRPTVMTLERLDAAKRMRARGASLGRIAAVLGVGKTTVARALKPPASRCNPARPRDRGGRRGFRQWRGAGTGDVTERSQTLTGQWVLPRFLVPGTHGSPHLECIESRRQGLLGIRPGSAAAVTLWCPQRGSNPRPMD